jgi:cell wall-associated NlpC family hydrolase
MRPLSLLSQIATVAFSVILLLGGCGNLSAPQPATTPLSNADAQGNDIVVFALGLVETEYRFGGKNPDAGLDCSGMVSYVFEKAIGLKLSGSAADIAHKGRAVRGIEENKIARPQIRNAHRPHSHVGIYIGDQRFVHAPSKNGKVRTDSLKSGWFAARFEEARSYFD